MAGWRRKAKSRVSRRKDDHAVPVRVTRNYFISSDQNLKTSFLSTSSSNKELFSASFEVASGKVSLDFADMTSLNNLLLAPLLVHVIG